MLKLHHQGLQTSCYVTLFQVKDTLQYRPQKQYLATSIHTQNAVVITFSWWPLYLSTIQLYTSD